MIDSSPPLKPRAPEPAASGAGRDAAETPESAPGAPDLRLAEREKRVVPAGPTIDVRLDGRTMRLYSELRDPVTDRVLMRLPAGYAPEEESGGAPGVSDEA